ncbi:hypothetical protein AVEN_101704-1 [Araneus ventricosus]|uniref:Uncharacterized protein n=1 Tax=Araneus ventricosus TaxID=182803 RepID=A0A4Y2MHV7_ARAVE|nr:hypothetical protein AVEN_101704-1 [Araneus ventricosus]
MYRTSFTKSEEGLPVPLNKRLHPEQNEAPAQRSQQPCSDLAEVFVQRFILLAGVRNAVWFRFSKRGLRDGEG